MALEGGSARARAAAVVAARQDELIRTWEQRVRRHIPAASTASSAVLVDTLPAFLDRLSEALSPGHPRETATEGTTIPREHGSERVRITSFRLRDVVREYQILRDVLFEALSEAGPLDEDVRRVVTSSIDVGLSDACTEFVLASEGLRERIMLALAHDLRTPLGAAKTAVGLILRRPQDEAVPRWATRADANIERIDRMIRTLLDVGRAGSGHRIALDIHHCDLVDVVRDVVDGMPAARGRMVLDAPSPAVGWWGYDALGRAIENLVGNATKYGAPDRPITVRLVPRHGRVALTVHNHGSYIPPEQRALLFDLFGRAADADSTGAPGWGVGLAFVRAVAEAHGGTVNVESLPDTGTSFTLDLPFDARPFQDAPAAAPP